MMRRMIGRALFLLAALLPPAFAEAPAAPDIEFQMTYLAVHGRRDATLTYDFDGDGKGDVFNSSIDLDKTPAERWAAIHLQKDGRYAEKPDLFWSIPARACALLFGDFLPGGGTEVGFLAEDGVYVHPPGKRGPEETPLKLLHVRTFFRSPSEKQIPVWQWRMDFTGDGLDDLVVPLNDGYRVYFQTAPGIFGKSVTLEGDLTDGARTLTAGRFAETPEIAPVFFQASTQLPKLEPVDINGDGLTDLVLIRKDTVTYFLQKEKGVFEWNRPYRVSYVVPTLNTVIKKDSVSLALIKFVDINQDKLADLVVTKIEGQLGLWESIKTSIYVHIGNGKGNFVASRRIVIDGVSIDPEFIDMNLDGKLDVVTSRLRTDLMKQAVDAFVLGDVQISYEVFQFDEPSNTFLDEPVFSKTVFVRKDDLQKSGVGAVPLVFIRGDLSGDGRPDLMHLDPKTSELLVHPGRIVETTKGPRINFDKTAHWTYRVDREPKGVQVMDVNSDGLNDVVLYHNGALGLLLSSRR